MDFAELSAFFDGCLFGDSLRSDFQAVQQAIHAQERDVYTNKSIQACAILSLKKAVFGMMRGTFVQAWEELESLNKLSRGLPERWQIRTAAYSLFLAYLRRTPHDIKHEMQQLQQRLERLESNSLRDLDKAELACLQATTIDHNDFLWMQAPFHPAYPPEIPAKALMLQISPHIASVDAPVMSLTALLESLQLDSTARYLHCLNFDALYTRSPNDPAQRFLEFLCHCSSAHDFTALAMACIVHGDHLVSPPTISLLALNLVLPGHLTGYQAGIWDESNFESLHQLKANSEADKYYNAALEVIQKVNSPRARGAVHLRKACIFHMDSLPAANSRDRSDTATKRAAAFKHIAEAEQCFRLDVMHLVLTTLHRTLLEITSEDRRISDGMIEQARKIGIDCHKHGNHQLSRFAGLLFLRFGRQQWLEHGSAGVFLHCCKCAEACFEGAQDIVYQYQTAIALAKFHCEVGAIPSAHTAVSNARTMLADADTILSQLRMRVPHCTNALNDVKAQLRGHLLDVENGIRLRSSDTSLIHSYSPHLSSILPIEYRKNATESINITHQISKNFNQAMADGRAALYEADFESYLSCIKAFLTDLDNSFDIKETSCAGYRIRALFLLGRHDQARLYLPYSIPRLLGGSGSHELFDSVSSMVVREFDPRIKDLELRISSSQLAKVYRQAIGNCVWVGDWSMAARVLLKVLELDPKYLDNLLGSRQPTDWQPKAELAAVYEHNDCLSEALKWYLHAVDEAEKHRSQTMDVASRMTSMSSMNSAELFGGLIRVTLRMHQAYLLSQGYCLPSSFRLHGKSWEEQALLFAEQGRARALLDVLTINGGDDDIKECFRNWKKESHIYRQYEDLMYNQRQSQSEEAQAESTRTQEIAHLKQMIVTKEGEKGLQKLWSKAHYLLAKTTLQHDVGLMLSAIPSDGLVIHCNTFEQETIIFAISNKSILRVVKRSLGRADLQHHILSFQRMMKSSGWPVGTSDPQLTEHVADLLASHLIVPIQDLIDSKQHVIFCLSHEMNAFPVNLLPLRAKPLCLQKSCSATPSLAALQHLQGVHSSQPEKSASIFVNRDETILMADAGAAKIAEIFETQTITTNGMGKIAFQTNYEAANLVYFATHGFKSKMAESSWQAHLISNAREIRDEHLTDRVSSLRVIDISSFHTKATLVIFSACLGALGEVTGGNDMIGFSHAILESGAQIFIGALWVVSDWATMIFMVILNRLLLQGKTNMSVATCLHQAQVHFYQLKNETAKALLEEVKVSWMRHRKADDNQEWFKGGRRALNGVIADLQDADVSWNFQDPYYWAAWVVVGNGDARLIDNEGSTRVRTDSILSSSAALPKTDVKETFSESPSNPDIATFLPDLSMSPMAPTLSQTLSSAPQTQSSPNVESRDQFSLPSPPSFSIRRTLLPFPIPPPPSTTPPPQLPPRPAQRPQFAYDPSTYAPSLPRGSGSSTSISQGSANPQVSCFATTPASTNAPQQVPSLPEPPKGPAPQQNIRQSSKQTQRKPVPSHRPYSDTATLQNPPPPPYTQRPPAQVTQPNQQRVSTQVNPNARRVSLGGPSTATQARMQHQQYRPQGQQISQPKQKSGSKMQRFLKHPGTRIGAGVLLGSFIGEAVSDLGGLFGGDDADGHSWITWGGDYAGESAGGTEYYDSGITGGDPTFEDNVLLGGAGEQGHEQYAYEDTGDQSGYMETTENTTGGGNSGGGNLPGQVGPCFEDNIILSRAAG